jgi:hypothetical protein
MHYYKLVFVTAHDCLCSIWDKYPDGATRMLEVKITDADRPDVHHGEAVLSFTGFDIIRAAALRNYVAPCPKPEQILNYVIRVSALDSNGKVISIAEIVRECHGSELTDQSSKL